jgi:hypothetical protein
MRLGPSSLALVLAAGLAGCGTTLSLRELDRLNRSTDALTIVLDPAFSLYSPFSAVATLDYRGLASSEVALVTGLFALEPTEPIPIFLQAVEGIRPRVSMDGGVFRVDSVAEHPLHGVEGVSGRDLVVVYVEPPFTTMSDDGRRLEGSWSADEYRGTLRHELVHYCAGLAGLDGDLWFNEGLAHAVQLGASETAGGVLVRTHQPTRVAAARLPDERRSLARVLSARENVPAIQAGKEHPDPDVRLIATSFFYFLLERRPEPGFRESVRAIRALSRAELLALEPAWQAWLEDAIAGG